jgi:hypothetical protein
MCFSSKQSAAKPTATPTTPNPNNAPAANQTASQPKPISSTVSADPLGQSQLGS